MKKPDEMPEYRAQLPRTGHNLSHNLAFTTTNGYLSPVFHDFLNAGETVTVGLDFNLRTQPLEAAAMSKLKVHTEYFFVPMQLLYQPFENWYYGIRDQFSSRLNSVNTYPLPLVDLQKVCNNQYTNRANYVPGAFETIGRNFYRMMELMGFQVGQNFALFCGTSGECKVFPYQFLAYQAIYQMYYRQDTRETYRNSGFNVDDAFQSGGIIPGVIEYSSTLRTRPLASDYFTDIKVSPIVDVLNLNNKGLLSVANNFLTKQSIDGISSGLVIKSGSIGDDLGDGTGNDSPFSFSDPSQYVQTQFGFNNVVADITDRSGTLPLNGMDIGTANIRAMFASEKLWSVTGRAKKTYDAQTLAHFGYEVPHDVKHDITCFGHDVAEINIGEVISTSNTASGGTGSPLGEIAGKGYGAQGNQRHKFTAPCHGVIMVIYSIVPEEYYIPTFAKFNKLSSRDDLFTPEYDHLGMQPLFGYECAPTLSSVDSTEIIGWQYRYEQWKRRWNRCTSIFVNGSTPGSLSSWFHTIKPYLEAAGASDVSTPNNDSWQYFSHRPDELNDLFLYQYSTAWSTAYETNLPSIYEGDPFVVNAHIDCVKVSTMSDYSLPRLED